MEARHHRRRFYERSQGCEWRTRVFAPERPVRPFDEGTADDPNGRYICHANEKDGD